MESRPIRILLGKMHFDTHDRGAKILSVALRDAGFEVIYSGLYQTAKALALAAEQEDVDIIGLSFLTDPPVPLIEAVFAELKKRDLNDIHVVCGGIIGKNDIPLLEDMGIKGIFGPGTPIKTIIADLKKLIEGNTQRR